MHGNALARANKFPRTAERLRSLCVRAVKQEHIGIIRFGRRSKGIEKPHIYGKADGASGLMHPLQQAVIAPAGKHACGKLRQKTLEDHAVVIG